MNVAAVWAVVSCLAASTEASQPSETPETSEEVEAAVPEPARHLFKERPPLEALVVFDHAPSLRSRTDKHPFYLESLRRFAHEMSDDDDRIEFLIVDRSSGSPRASRARQLRVLRSSLTEGLRRILERPRFSRRTLVLVTDFKPKRPRTLQNIFDDAHAAEVLVMLYHLSDRPSAAAKFGLGTENESEVRLLPSALGLFSELYILIKDQAPYPTNLVPAYGDTTIPVYEGDLMLNVDVLHGRLGEVRMEMRDALGRLLDPVSQGRYHSTYRADKPIAGEWHLIRPPGVWINHLGVARFGSYRAQTEGSTEVANDPIPESMMNFDPNASTFYAFDPPVGGDPPG
ncbi:MAG: hypothetical protein AAF658_11895, partial [Myxococcota bacterium]